MGLFPAVFARPMGNQTMKTRIAALSLLLLAGAGPAALAQERDDGDRPEAVDDRDAVGRVRGFQRDSRPEPLRDNPAPRPPPPPEPPQAREAPTAPTPPSAGEDRRRAGDPTRWVGRGVQGGRPPVIDSDGDEINDGLTGADRQDREDRDEWRQWRRRGGERRPDGTRPVEADRRVDPNDRRTGQPPQDGDRRTDNDRRWDGHRRGPPANHPRWDRRRYPSIYSSRHRYRGHYWSPPIGFYVHVWNFGEHLPRGWYQPNYRILDWWTYDLPVPPPGYVWVRIGDDALLTDEFNGRVIQVVRYVFW